MEGIDRQELERHHAAGWGWALHCCRHRRDVAEDVLQASYLKLLDGRARFDGRSSLQTFLFGVIRRTAAEHRRAKMLRGGLLDTVRGGLEALAQRSRSPDLEDSAEASVDGIHLRSLLKRLSRRQNDLLHLVFYQERTVDEAAEILGISAGTARQHYHRGKARLRNLLTETENGHVPART